MILVFFFLILQINAIEDNNRYILVFTNTKPEVIVTLIEDIRLSIQQFTGYITIVESVRARIRNTNGVLNFDETFIVSQNSNATHPVDRFC